MKLEKHLLKPIPKGPAMELHRLGMRMAIAGIAVQIYPKVRILKRYKEPSYKRAFDWIGKKYALVINIGKCINDANETLFTCTVTRYGLIRYEDALKTTNWNRIADKALNEVLTLVK